MFTDLEGKQSWKQCFSVSGVRLPTGYFIGVSAVTGDLSDNHDIIGVRFYELDTDKVRQFIFIFVMSKHRKANVVNLVVRL